MNRAQAQTAGLLWGAYHFGVGADGVKQVDFFLRTVQPGPEDLPVLDFEADAQEPSLTLEEARAFVTHINEPPGQPSPALFRSLRRGPSWHKLRSGFGQLLVLAFPVRAYASHAGQLAHLNPEAIH